MNEQQEAALRQALEQQPAGEPVAYMGTDTEGNPNKFRLNPFGGSVPLYEHPAKPVKVWDAEGYDALMQQMEMVKAENHRLRALVRAQQITIEKLEQQPADEPVAWVVEDQSGERLEWAGDVPGCMGLPTFPLYTRPQPAAQHIEHCIWARNGNTPCPHTQPAAPAMFGGGLVAIKTLLSRDPCAHAKVAIEMIDAMLAHPAAPFIDGLESAHIRLQKRYAELEAKLGKPAAPQRSEDKKQWIGLTTRERDQFFKYVTMTELVDAIEAKLREKNGGNA